MKITFITSRTTAPSYLFYRDSFLEMNSSGMATVVLEGDPTTVQTLDSDVILYMGYDAQPHVAREKCPNALVGVVEPRPPQQNSFEGADFILVNSLESYDFFAKGSDNLLIYYTFPTVLSPQGAPDKKGLVLGYHGNKIHLDAMYPRITDAIERLSAHQAVELWAMYNMENLGKWALPEKKGFSFTVRHIPYSEENYAQYIAHTDIGIVPQFIPVKSLWKRVSATLRRRFNEEPNDYFQRYKVTSNIGRHLVFAQYGIPTVSDLTPSAAVWAEEGKCGFAASSTEAWSLALQTLVRDEDMRHQIGVNSHEKYLEIATPEKQNEKLLAFLKGVQSKRGKIQAAA